MEGGSVAADARYVPKNCSSKVADDHILRIVQGQGMTLEDFGGFCSKECLFKNIEDKVSGEDVVRVDHHLCDRKDCSAILRDAIAYIDAPIVIWTDGFIVASVRYSSMSFDGDLAGVPCYQGTVLGKQSLLHEGVLGMLISEGHQY